VFTIALERLRQIKGLHCDMVVCHKHKANIKKTCVLPPLFSFLLEGASKPILWYLKAPIPALVDFNSQN